MAVNTLTEQLDTLYTTTWQLRRKKIWDQVFEKVPLYHLLTSKGRLQHEEGGTRIEEPLQYKENETVTAIGRGGTVDLKGTDPLTTAWYDWKYITGHLLRYFVDFQKNRGKAAQIKRANVDINNLRASTIKKLETDAFGDGTGDGGKTIGGLQLLIDISPATGTVGGIDAATYDWWRNQATSMLGESVALLLTDRMTTMFNTCSKYGQESLISNPDLLITTQTICESYETECRGMGQIAMPHTGVADLGFGEFAFKGQAVTWAPSCPNYRMYFVNSECLRMVADDIEWLNLGEWLSIVNQPRDRVAHSMTVCNLTCGNRRKQGVLYDIGGTST